MKKTKYFLFSLLCVFCYSVVFADNEIVIKSITSFYDEESTVVVSEDNSVTFNDKDQLVEYKVVLENVTDKDLLIEDITLSKPTEDFLIYEFEGLKKNDVLAANSEHEVIVSLSTIKKEGWGRNFNDELFANISFTDDVLNPSTNTMGIVLILIIITFFTTILIILVGSKRISKYIIFVIMFSYLGSVTNAKESLILPIKINASYESQNVMAKTYTIDESGRKNYDTWGNFTITDIYFEDGFREIDNYSYVRDVSEKEDGSILAYYVKNGKLVKNSTDAWDPYREHAAYDLYFQADGIIYANPDASYYFANTPNLANIHNIEQLDTSQVTDMSYMFYDAGSDSENLVLKLNSFDTSKVTNMSHMFYDAAEGTEILELDISSFDTSKVTDMSYMFAYFGRFGDNIYLDLSSFDTSNVINMDHMFFTFGAGTENFKLDLSNFDTSNVTNMSSMFRGVGANSKYFNLDVGSFDTSKVTDMSYMFQGVGTSVENLNINLLNFNTSNVVNMYQMFEHFGYNAKNISLDLTSFDTGKVTDMGWMFCEAGYNSESFVLDLSSFDTRNVTSFFRMFDKIAYNNVDFSLDVSGFDTSKVTNIGNMFDGAGYNSTKLNTSITIRNSGTTSYYSMFANVATKPGSKITVNYTSATSSLVDKMIATKSSNSNVVKGVQVD